jgi:hypothetical protein
MGKGDKGRQYQGGVRVWASDLTTALALLARANFDRFESGVVAGLVPATPNFEAQHKDNRGGRDKPGHDGCKRGLI